MINSKLKVIIWLFKYQILPSCNQNYSESWENRHGKKRNIENRALMLLSMELDNYNQW